MAGLIVINVYPGTRYSLNDYLVFNSVVINCGIYEKYHTIPGTWYINNSLAIAWIPLFGFLQTLGFYVMAWKYVLYCCTDSSARTATRSACGSVAALQHGGSEVGTR